MNISEIVQSSRFKNFMKYLYGWGASIVLLGALFKLQHWPGAGIMLTIGMSVEALIFFMSAFEPIAEDVDWTIVFPELAGITDEVSGGRLRGGNSMDPGMLESIITSAIAKSSANLSGGFPGIAGGAMAGAAASAVQPSAPAPAPVSTGQGALVFTEKFNDMLEKAEIGPELFTKVGAGLDRLSEASNGIARISDAVASTEIFSKNMQRAGGAVGKFAESYENSGALVTRASQVLSQSFESTAQAVNESGKSFSSQVQEIVSKMGANLSQATESVSKEVADSGKQIEAMNKNMAALNAAHEIQVKGVQDRLKQSDQLSAGVEDMMARLAKTVEDSQKYSQSVATLTENVSQLNTIYGNMLSAMGSMMGGK